MKVVFKTMEGGVGIFLEIDMELVQTTAGPDIEEVNEGIYLWLPRDMPSIYNEGRHFITEVIRKYSVLIKEHMGDLKIIKVNSANSNPAHYQAEAFIGATILWLNKSLNINLDMPKFTFDTEERKFLVNNW